MVGECAVISIGVGARCACLSPAAYVCHLRCMMLCRCKHGLLAFCAGCNASLSLSVYACTCNVYVGACVCVRARVCVPRCVQPSNGRLPWRDASRLQFSTRVPHATETCASAPPPISFAATPAASRNTMHTVAQHVCCQFMATISATRHVTCNADEQQHSRLSYRVCKHIPSHSIPAAPHCPPHL